MRAHRSLSSQSTVVHATFVAIVVLAAALPVRAQDAAPVAAPPAVPQSNVAQPSQQAPASAPAPSDANFPTGLVERLPSSAYPEPVIRGLYGGSLWLDMQGHQWPYYSRIGVGISGYGWVDTNYKYTRVGDPGQSAHNTLLFGQGRFALRLTPTYTNGSWFAQVQAELIANLNQLDVQPKVADTDDLWVRTGVWQTWDVTVGRFESFTVYHLGMGLDLNTDERIGAYDQSQPPVNVPQPYLASFMYYRPTQFGLGITNVAFHFYPGGIFRNPGILRALLSPIRLELLAQWGNDGSLNNIGGRPALIYDLGWLKLRGALEYQWKFAPDPAPGMHNEQTNKGAAGSLQFVVAPWIEFGPNIGRAVTDVISPMSFASGTLDNNRSGDIWSYGGFLNARPFGDLLIGLGANYASFTNLHLNTATNQYDRASNQQYFAAIQYLVRRQLFIKVVGGYAKSHFIASFSTMAPYDDDMFSVRVRLMYLY